MIQKDSNGITGGHTFRFGDSSYLSIGGHLARTDVRRLKAFVQNAERYLDTAGEFDTAGGQYGFGYLDSGCPRFIDTTGILEDIAKGAGMVRDVVNSPIGQAAAAATGPYGAAIMAAANGVPAALDLVKKQGGLGEHAQTIAQLVSPLDNVRRAAERRVQEINRASENPKDPRSAKAKRIREGLRKAMALHLRTENGELRALCNVFRQRLAEYGDPIAWQGTADTGANMGPAMDALYASVDRSLARSRVAPQPTFRFHQLPRSPLLPPPLLPPAP